MLALSRWCILFLAAITSCQSKQPDSLTIAVSANMQFAAAELLDDFSESTGTACQLVKGSSGKLTAQIKQGAPFDVFLSADVQHPELLFVEGFAENEPKIYAYGHLVLWTAQKERQAEIGTLTDFEVKHIAVANPDVAPYGKATQEVLWSLSVFDSVQPKLVFGESISQVNQFVMSSSADLGFTSLSSVKAVEMQNLGNWTRIEEELYTPISQAAIALKASDSESSSMKATAFITYLSSARAQEILLKHGYSLPQ